MDTKVLFKHRSVTACMKASYDMISGNITSLLKKTWWAVLIFAIFMALTVYFRMPNKGLHDWGENSPWASFILQSLVYLFAWLSCINMGAAFWAWLTKRPYAHCLLRYGIAILVFDLLTILCDLLLSGGVMAYYTSAVAKAAAGNATANAATNAANAAANATTAIAANAPTTSTYIIMAILAIVGILISLVVLLPFGYVIPKVMLMEKGEKIEPWKTFKKGFRYSGAIFKMGFLGTIILCVIACIIVIPASILGWAQLSSQLGALEGDPLGVPRYFTPLFLVVLTFTMFVISYTYCWLGISFAFLYGSKKTQEEERRLALEKEGIGLEKEGMIEK